MPLRCTGADVGQTARAAAGDGSDGGAQQRQPAGGAVVMVTVGRDHAGPEGHGAASSGHPTAENADHRAPGGPAETRLHRQEVEVGISCLG